MAEVSAISGVIGIVGFVGQITQGCAYLRNLIDDIRDAPKELQNLREELDIIEKVINKLSNQNSIETANPALQLCLDTISTLNEEIAPALLAFSKSKGAKRNWNQLKTAFSKHQTKKKLEKLNRAKMKLSLALASDQTTKVADLKTAVIGLHTNTQEILTGITTGYEGMTALQSDTTRSLALLHDAATNSQETMRETKQVGHDVAFVKSRLMENQDSISALQTDTSTSIHHLRRAEKANENIHTSIGSVEDRVLRFEAQSSTTARNIQESIQTLTTIVTSHIYAEAPRLEAAFGKMINSSMNEVFGDHNSNKPGHDKGIVKKQQDMLLHEPSLEKPIRNSGLNVRGRPSYRRTSYSRHRYLFIDVLIETFELKREAKASSPNTAKVYKEISDSGFAKRSYTKTQIFPRYGIFNRRLEFQRTRHTYGGLFDMRIRTYNIVSRDSTIFEVAESGDLLTMMNLFDTHQASPFDMDERGLTPLGSCLSSFFACWPKDRDPDGTQRTDMIKWLIKLDGKPRFNGIQILEILRFETAGQNREEILHLLLESCEQDSFESIIVRSFLSLDNIDHSLTRVLLHQEHWIMEWDALPIDVHGALIEGELQILKDPEGKFLAEALKRHKRSSESSDISMNYLVFGNFSDQDRENWNYSFHGLLRLVGNRPTNRELKQACLNRMVILLTHGSDARGTGAGFFLSCVERNVSQYAISKDTVHVWEEALRLAGWSDFEIMNLLDEVWYFKIPEIFGGEIYMGAQDCCEEFRELLITGEYRGIFKGPIYLRGEIWPTAGFWSLYDGLSHFRIAELIDKASEVFSRRSIPGAWPDELKCIEPEENSEFDDLMRESGMPWGLSAEEEGEGEG